MSFEYGSNSALSALPRMTYAPVSGRMTSIIILNMRSPMSSARFAPQAEPESAKATQNTACFHGIKPLFVYRTVVSVVPMAELILFVPMAKWTGKPAMRYAGRDISPPPPATASTKPARKTSGQTMRN